MQICDHRLAAILSCCLRIVCRKGSYHHVLVHTQRRGCCFCTVPLSQDLQNTPSLELHHLSFFVVRCPRDGTVFQTDFFLLSATFLCKSSINSSGVLNILPLLFRACSTSLISSLESGGDENLVFDITLPSSLQVINLRSFMWQRHPPFPHAGALPRTERNSRASKNPESSRDSWSENIPSISKSSGERAFCENIASTATISPR